MPAQPALPPIALTLGSDYYLLCILLAAGLIQTIRAIEIEIKDRAGHESYLFFSALPPICFLTLTGPSELGPYAAGGMGVRNTDSSQAHGCVPPMTLTTSRIRLDPTQLVQLVRLSSCALYFSSPLQ